MMEQTKLDRFISSFKSEAELRGAVVGLLERMPDASNVRLTHGSQERGKDIVFHSIGPFDQRQLVACVVKNEKISGSAQSDEGARTVYVQAEQALDTPIANVANGSEERVAHVFVISPYECVPATVESIKGKLQARPGQVTFLCGRELMEKFEKHYPEFLLFQSGLYGSYIAALEKGLDSDPAVVNLLFRHGFLSAPKTLAAFYVRPKFSRELHGFELRISQPQAETLRNAITVHELEALQRPFREIGKFVAAITYPGGEGAFLQDAFLDLADKLKRRRQDAFDARSRRADLTIEERSQPKSVVRVQLDGADELYAEAQNLLTRAHSITTAFAQTLKSAARCVEYEFATENDALESALLLDYCQAEAVSRLVPSILYMKSIPDRTLEFGETLTDCSGATIFITGPAGFGKTSFCKWQTLHELKKLREAESDLVPLYIPLHQYAQSQIGSFESTFLKAPELIALWDRRREKPDSAPIRRFKLYLDGLDEVPSVDRQRTLLELVTKAKEAEPTLSIVVTGREHVVGTHLQYFPRIRVRDFDEGQLRQLATKWFDNDENSVGEFFDQLAKVPALRPLMPVPLLATLVFGVYKNTKTLPESRVRLYEMFVNLLAGGWDVAKNVQRQTEFGPAPKLIVLIKLAATLHIGGRRDCNQPDFKAAVKETLSGLGEKWQLLLEEIVHDGLLIPTGLTFAFAHLSFQEYLAAKDLFEPSGRKASQAFRNFLAGDDWWREVAAFYVALSTDPKDIEQFIRKMAEKVLSKTADDNVKSRAHFLLEALTMSFPGAKPNFAL